jgi:ribose transport system substrate-binding protein
VPTDAAITGGVGAAVQSSGRSPQILKMGGEGQPANMDLMREGRQQDAGVGYPPDWEGWSAMDGLNRMFNDEEPVSSGIGLQLFDKDHNMPASGGYKPPVDFRAAYRKAWGLE